MNTFTVDADGFKVGYVDSENAADYHAGRTTAHPALSAHGAMQLLKCPSDFQRTHPALSPDYVPPPKSEAFANGTLIDTLLLGTRYEQGPLETLAPNGRGQEVSYEDWNGFRIVHGKSFKTKAAEQLCDEARDMGLTPILHREFDQKVKQVPEYLARLELAGFRLDVGVSGRAYYWVREVDGFKVQCKALLDHVDDETRPGWCLITDLKTAAQLDDKFIARSINDYGYNLQLATYMDACNSVHDALVESRLAFLRLFPVPAARVVPMNEEWLHFGMLKWDLALERFAASMQSGQWEGWESEREAPVMEPYMMSEAKRLLGVVE